MVNQRELIKCCKAYKAWRRACGMGHHYPRRNNLHFINYYAIKKYRENREDEDGEFFNANDKMEGMR